MLFELMLSDGETAMTGFDQVGEVRHSGDKPASESQLWPCPPLVIFNKYVVW